MHLLAAIFRARIICDVERMDEDADPRRCQQKTNTEAVRRFTAPPDPGEPTGRDAWQIHASVLII